MSAFWLLLALTSLIVAGSLVEGLVHRHRLRRIPVRIHVNGTRGKSSVTRLIAAGLREGGIITCAKTTGTLPRMIFPDGAEYPVFRPSGPNVIEQVRIVSAAEASQARVLVMECMALLPFLQWFCERRLIQATHGVITNAREDHLDVMGPDEINVARALAGMVPVGGKLFTTERRHLDVLSAAARDRRCTMIAVPPEEVDAVTPQELAGFAYIEHPDNVALALRVCADLGVDRDIALRGMHTARPDAGAMSVQELPSPTGRLVFVNGFAANDPESTGQIWNIALRRYPEMARRIAVFNCRSDRPDRSLVLGRACVHWPAADRYVLIGTGTHVFVRAAARQGMDMSRMVVAEHRSAAEIFQLVSGLAGPSALIMGMGNIGGPGLELVRFFHHRGEAGEAA